MDYYQVHLAIMRHLLCHGEDAAGQICRNVPPSGAIAQNTALEQLVASGDVVGPDLFAKYRLSDKAAAQLAGVTRRPLAVMRKAAERLMVDLAPHHIVRLEISGSIRRLKPDCKDIEICALSRGGDLACALRERALIILKTGPKYTQVIITDPDAGPVLVDLFQTEDPAQWGMLFWIRTGCADFVARGLAHWKKVSPNGYCHENTLRTVTGQIIPTPEEADVFKALQCPFIAPERRVEKTVAPSS